MEHYYKVVFLFLKERQQINRSKVIELRWCDNPNFHPNTHADIIQNSLRTNSPQPMPKLVSHRITSVFFGTNGTYIKVFTISLFTVKEGKVEFGHPQELLRVNKYISYQYYLWTTAQSLVLSCANTSVGDVVGNTKNRDKNLRKQLNPKWSWIHGTSTSWVAFYGIDTIKVTHSVIPFGQAD